jgi:hypothetical protein
MATATPATLTATITATAPPSSLRAVSLLENFEAAPLPAAVGRSFAQHATTMFFPHFVGDACTIAVMTQSGHWQSKML